MSHAQSPTSFWSQRPAGRWEESLVTGNGIMGAMVEGNPYREHVVLNHSLLFLPINPIMMPPSQGKHLDEIRQMMLGGRFEEASQLLVDIATEEGYVGKHNSDLFVPACRLAISADSVSPTRNYRRSVDFRTGVCRIEWQDGRGSYVRETFVSRADNVVVMRLRALSGKLDTRLALERITASDPGRRKKFKMNDNDRIETSLAGQGGRLLYYRAKYDTQTVHPVSGQKGYEGYEAAVRIAECDGSVRPGAGGLEITGATEVLLLARVEPTRDFSKPAYTAMVASLDSLGGYGLLLERHVARHQPLYDRVKIDLGAPAADRSLSSEQLLATGGRNLALIERLFNAARYNVISATGLHAPCLQGIWGAKMTPNWAGDFTTNGNLPVAISHMLQANTPELMLSLFNQLEAHMDDFRTNARVLFNCQGIHIPSHFYTHGLDCQFDKTWPMTFWVAGAPWYSMFYWDYYLYTRDREFLRRRALPFMEESVAFFEDFLTEVADGKYIVNPSYSPENHPKNYKMQACINATMDIAAIKALLRAVIEASRTLGANSDRIPAWQAMLDKMPAYGNNADGEFREWLWADMEGNHEHRHASHLIGLYDLHDPEIMQSRELRQGALKAIDRRMDFRRKENTGVMAFGICQLAFSAAALGQADRCEEMLGWLGDNYFLDNMFSTHDPHNIFNCDISGGYPSLVMKMLCYSEPGRIDIFPAKPSSWRRGSIKGMALRGGIIMEELRWDGSKTTVTLRADDTQKVSVTIYGKHVKNVRLKKGKPTTLAL
jgi:alpha-L-fucosidase 2